jgi:hypothetical protein
MFACGKTNVSHHPAPTLGTISHTILCFVLGWAMENLNLAFKTSQIYEKENSICVLQRVWYSSKYPQTSLNMNEFL